MLPAFRFACVLVIFSLALVCILRRVFEQLVHRRAVTMLRCIRCNIVILMAAPAWLMLSFSSCVVCGFDSYTVLFKCPQRVLWGHLRSTFKCLQSNFLCGNLKSTSSVLRETFSGDTGKVGYTIFVVTPCMLSSYSIIIQTTAHI